MRINSKGSVSGKTMTMLIIAFVVLALSVSSMIYLLEKIGQEDDPDLVIYTYESFMDLEYGLGPAVIPLFEEMYGVTVKVVAPGDVGDVLGKLDAQKDDPVADIAIGIDNSMLFKAVKNDLFESYTPENFSRIDPSLVFDPGHYMVPYDHGYIAIICNRQMMEDRGLDIPDDLLDLADPQYDGQMLLLDPAASSTGSSFMIWSAMVAGENYSAFFNDLAENANGRVLSSWSAMYDAWGGGEAPIAISYGLDTAYEVKYYGSNNTITVVPDHQGYRQIEGACLVKGAQHEVLAKKFLEFILSDEFQSEVYRNVMLPVVPTIDIDPIFAEYGEDADIHVEPTIQIVMENYDIWYDEWRNAFFT